ncbi:hypothetical protein EZV62_011519 [Acer yangbiense]|uniref:Uncharacterized protein n=1 Tax=Acer yangbiense TaxID=1000413 RepID=A0A5C7I5Z4_9ROSI|nr:hypothetical protein EZV62_011519 [Acer yangbiense]
MATSLLSPLSTPAKELAAPTHGLSKSSFLSNNNLFSSASLLLLRRKPDTELRMLRLCELHFIPSFVVMDNYKNAPQYLYGLSPAQMDMFMTEDNAIHRLSEKVTEVDIKISKIIMCH